MFQIQEDGKLMTMMLANMELLTGFLVVIPVYVLLKQRKRICVIAPVRDVNLIIMFWNKEFL